MALRLRIFRKHATTYSREREREKNFLTESNESRTNEGTASSRSSGIQTRPPCVYGAHNVICVTERGNYVTRSVYLEVGTRTRANVARETITAQPRKRRYSYNDKTTNLLTTPLLLHVPIPMPMYLRLRSETITRGEKFTNLARGSCTNYFSRYKLLARVFHTT